MDVIIGGASHDLAAEYPVGCHQPAKEYGARRTIKTKTKTEILRCLKRQRDPAQCRSDQRDHTSQRLRHSAGDTICHVAFLGGVLSSTLRPRRVPDLVADQYRVPRRGVGIALVGGCGGLSRQEWEREEGQRSDDKDDHQAGRDSLSCGAGRCNREVGR